MPSRRNVFTRRQLLTTATGATVALAGCARESESVDDAAYDEPRTESTHEYESLSVRADDADYFVFRDEEAAQEAEEEDDERPSLYRRSRLFVLSLDDAEALWIDPSLADEDEAEIRDFLEATDFEHQSIVVHQRTIEDCYERLVLGVQADNDQFRASFCRPLKPPTESCAADRERMQATIIRVDRPYDERPSSSGSSESASCPDSAVAHRAESASEENASSIALNTSVNTGEDE
ncbi:hypothetical protein [Natronobacterium gregoryi]|uniref:Uncharacterized protein n=2 Tax=Natronobacterium gregoryi TaxID=44930 RepID=L0AD15_NATGS|nr:hypothetical protein [Natronobacterium gregoryi]AFZ71324.1 hypothetical protein Natgr_0054 [Natronobacterium gregoryi SP2]ELY67213.1 hypothetical protein C490_11436 [Natronobacterium gregoryi SP2]PLK19170.1 hypothetical protein CYV19_16320 [Natronobacterium gregoryi SP2]SFJ59109.1 hypothetical protein SAMN05443661_14327 [Natronobacterium gregoryi]